MTECTLSKLCKEFGGEVKLKDQSLHQRRKQGCEIVDGLVWKRGPLTAEQRDDILARAVASDPLVDLKSGVLKRNRDSAKLKEKICSSCSTKYAGIDLFCFLRCMLHNLKSWRYFVGNARMCTKCNLKLPTLKEMEQTRKRPALAAVRSVATASSGSVIAAPSSGSAVAVPSSGSAVAAPINRPAKVIIYRIACKVYSRSFLKQAKKKIADAMSIDSASSDTSEDSYLEGAENHCDSSDDDMDNVDDDAEDSAEDDDEDDLNFHYEVVYNSKNKNFKMYESKIDKLFKDTEEDKIFKLIDIVKLANNSRLYFKYVRVDNTVRRSKRMPEDYEYTLCEEIMTASWVQWI